MREEKQQPGYDFDPPYPASTPVITNYDRLVSMTPNEMALWFAKTFGDEGDYNMWMKFLCASADKEGDNGN